MALRAELEAFVGPLRRQIAAPDFPQKAYRHIKISHSLTAAVTPEKAWHRAGGRCASDKRLAVALDHDDFGSIRSKIMNVIDSNILRAGCGRKTATHFSSSRSDFYLLP
jgi:hypothetical protein